MIFYISGPMTGYEDYNRPAFNTLAEKLCSQGYEVINPAQIYPDTKIAEPTWIDYMKVDLTAMMKADTVVVLPNWENSKGANIEVGLAKILGMKILDSETMEEIQILSRVDVDRIKKTGEKDPKTTCFSINGSVSTEAPMSVWEFLDEFIDWVESKGYSFGGGTTAIDDDGNILG